jgi:hypothetical protein
MQISKNEKNSNLSLSFNAQAIILRLPKIQCHYK